MTAIKRSDGIDILRLPISAEEKSFRPWKIKYTQSHILHSKCSKTDEACSVDPCHFCVYNRSLELRHLPDMVFPNNILSLEHEGGAKIEFNALDALKRVAHGRIDFQLPCAAAWKELRSDCKEFLIEKVKPFDWTFTTDYMGTISGFDVEDTDARIDFDQLMKREAIQFYHDLTLFEDEVHDNGIASLSVKIRVMPASLFILLRYFLRVDGAKIKINDTRIYHNFTQPYLLREYTSRESKITDLNVPPALLIEPSLIAPRLPLKHSCYHKLSIPPKREENTIDPSNNESTTDVQSTDTNTIGPDNKKHESEASNSVT